MIVASTDLPDVLHVRSPIHADARGFFTELHHVDKLAAFGVPSAFVQDNLSRSTRHVLRGLHYQQEEPQGKYVRVLTGRIFDVAVDLRRSSPRFMRWVGVTLDADAGDALWIPPGFAHGFLVLSESADVFYKCTTSYRPAAECIVRWNDPALDIRWPLSEAPLLSPRDAAAPALDPEACFA